MDPGPPLATAAGGGSTFPRMGNAEPNDKGYWRRQLRKHSNVELVALREDLEEILTRSSMSEVRALLIGAHDELVSDLVEGPVRPLALTTKRTGHVAGLRGLENLIVDIRELAAEAETQQMRRQVEHLQRREEVRP